LKTKALYLNNQFITMANFKVSVPKPCHESWAAMTPDTQGRFCSLCEKTVVDFTGMPAPEISSYLMANAGKKVCGRFNPEQVEAKPFIPQIPRSILFSQTSFRKMFLLALFITMGTSLFSCKDHNDNNMVLGEPAFIDTILPIDTINSSDSVTTKHTSAIKGTSGRVKPDNDTVVFQISNDKIVGEVAPQPAIIEVPTHLMGDTIVTPQ
jgi:hypothetical protein